ncbi:hypothetical protein P691DRAFT_695943 [Macrolepiota fuliginosa MF-IS2]|uniref:Rhodanese domain-containing protein n=1 Tax=Macrolepiota fuliginosa MF-IS2 TaxID=1400762 RepID=A0A9P6C8H9_9AGAR|nr:hypothetical protein P691DRAFT_695943 [Macrolepiota fuliginosa MF-IS2]
MKYITKDELAEMMKDETLVMKKDYVVIDVRDEDRAGGHIIGSISRPSAEFHTGIDQLIKTTKDVPLVIFHCALSQMRYVLLSRNMYEETRNNILWGDAAVEKQQVAVLRDGFVGFQDKYRHDPKLVEKWDKEVWAPNVIALPANLDDLIPESSTNTST